MSDQLLLQDPPVPTDLLIPDEIIEHNEFTFEIFEPKQHDFDIWLREADAQKLDHDEEAGDLRRLLHIELPRDESFVGLVVIDQSTKRQSVLRVPPKMQTCQQAAAWAADIDDPRGYHPATEM